LNTLTAELNRRKDLEAQFEKFKASSISDRDTALTSLTSNLQDKHQKEMDDLESCHKAEISELKSTSLKFREALSYIKATFETDKQAAVDKAVMEIRGIMADEIHSQQALHTRMTSQLSSHQVEVNTLRSQCDEDKAKIKELNERLMEAETELRVAKEKLEGLEDE